MDSLFSGLGAAAAYLGLVEPALKPGHTRLRWPCRCGSEIWDDFMVIAPGESHELNTQTVPSVNGRQRSQDIPMTQTSTQRYNANTATGSPPSDLRHLAPSASVEGIAADQQVWVYGIFELNRSTDQLVKLRVPITITDQRLFSLLYSQYPHQGSHIHRLFSMRRVKKISVVRFVHAPNGPDVHQFDDWPTNEYAPLWTSSGGYPPFLPRVGYNHLLHMWRDPFGDHGPISQASYASLRLPKKTGAQLRYGDFEAEEGWGLFLKEGLDLRSI
ncbi:MAG: hypothetical protein Q9208_007577 [Pyrenodesmia sp. 3 TL-2023]